MEPGGAGPALRCRWKELDFSALPCQGVGMPRELGCCSVRAKRSPNCQLWRAAGSWPRGACGLKLQGSLGLPSGAATSPYLWQRPSRLDKKVWRKEEGVRAGGRAGQREGCVTSWKLTILLKSIPGYPGSKTPDTGALRPTAPKKFPYLSNPSKRGLGKNPQLSEDDRHSQKCPQTDGDGGLGASSALQSKNGG